MRYRVVVIFAREDTEDTLDFPHLRPYVEDESEVFVVEDIDGGDFWPASEFFYMKDITSFET